MPKKIRLCSVDGCEAKHVAKGLCHNHYDKKKYQENSEARRIYQKAYRKENREAVLISRKEHYQENREAISISKKAYYQENSEAILASQKEYYQKNREALLISHEAYRKANSEAKRIYSKTYYQKHKAAKQLYNKAYGKKNPHNVRARQAKRRTMKRNAYPSWLSDEHQKQIAFKYKIAAKMTAMTGVTYEVDHIIPLSAGSACGLHVPWNLRVITAKENRSRPKKFTSEELTYGTL